METNQDIDPTEISQFILRTIREHYNSQADRPLLVTDIGSAISFRYKRRFAILWPEETLSEFIRRRLPLEVTLMRHRDQHASVAIVPRDRPDVLGITANDWAEFQMYPSSVAQASFLGGGLERFQPWAWAMITKPKADSRQRFLSLVEKKFYDVSPPVDSKVASRFTRIDDSFIVPSNVPDGAERRRLTIQNLKAWISKNNLNVEDFLDSPSAVEARKEKREISAADTVRNFIGMLTNQDQDKVQISLASLLNIVNRLEKGGSE